MLPLIVDNNSTQKQRVYLVVSFQVSIDPSNLLNELIHIPRYIDYIFKYIEMSNLILVKFSPYKVSAVYKYNY